MTETEDRLLTTKEVAQFLRVKPQTLMVWRCKGLNKELPYIKVGGKVLYRVSDIKAYLQRK